MMDGFIRRGDADRSGERLQLRDVAFILSCFLASRVALEIIGLLAAILIRPHLNYPFVWIYSDQLWLGIWGVFDTGWYLDLARKGYSLAPLASGQANWAFFPLYPMLCEAIARATGWLDFAVMVAVSNLAFVAALFLAAQETTAAFGRDAARWVVALFCFLPGSYFFSAAYTESLYLLLILGCFASLRRRRRLLAGAVAALAALTRNTGVALTLPMLVCGLQEYRARQDLGLGVERGEVLRFGLCLILPAVALAGFCGYLHFRTGDAFAFATIQKSWGRQFHLPFSDLFAQLSGHAPFDWAQTLNWAAAVAGFFALAILLRRRQWMLFSFGVFAPLCTGPVSFLRFEIANAPNVMAVAHFCAKRSGFAAILLASAAVLDGAMMMFWTIGQPISF